jgi:hypothetical protein
MYKSASRHDQLKQPKGARASDHLPELDYQNLVIDAGGVKTAIYLQHPRMALQARTKQPKRTVTN